MCVTQSNLCLFHCVRIHREYEFMNHTRLNSSQGDPPILCWPYIAIQLQVIFTSCRVTGILFTFVKVSNATYNYMSRTYIHGKYGCTGMQHYAR